MNKTRFQLSPGNDCSKSSRHACTQPNIALYNTTYWESTSTMGTPWSDNLFIIKPESQQINYWRSTPCPDICFAMLNYSSMPINKYFYNTDNIYRRSTSCSDSTCFRVRRCPPNHQISTRQSYIMCTPHIRQHISLCSTPLTSISNAFVEFL